MSRISLEKKNAKLLDIFPHPSVIETNKHHKSVNVMSSRLRNECCCDFAKSEFTNGPRIENSVKSIRRTLLGLSNGLLCSNMYS